MINGDLIYSDLSYKIIGVAYDIDNEIGKGLSEKVYCDSVETLFNKRKIPYVREYYCPIKIEDKVIAKRYFDFLVDNKVVVEVKVGDYKYRETCQQLFQYLKSSGLYLGIIIRFTKNGVKIKRIPNLLQ